MLTFYRKYPDLARVVEILLLLISMIISSVIFVFTYANDGPVKRLIASGLLTLYAAISIQLTTIGGMINRETS